MVEFGHAYGLIGALSAGGDGLAGGNGLPGLWEPPDVQSGVNVEAANDNDMGKLYAGRHVQRQGRVRIAVGDKGDILRDVLFALAQQMGAQMHPKRIERDCKRGYTSGQHRSRPVVRDRQDGEIAGHLILILL